MASFQTSNKKHVCFVYIKTFRRKRIPLWTYNFFQIAKIIVSQLPSFSVWLVMDTNLLKCRKTMTIICLFQFYAGERQGNNLRNNMVKLLTTQWIFFNLNTLWYKLKIKHFHLSFESSIIRNLSKMSPWFFANDYNFIGKVRQNIVCVSAIVI